MKREDQRLDEGGQNGTEQKVCKGSEAAKGGVRGMVKLGKIRSRRFESRRKPEEYEDKDGDDAEEEEEGGDWEDE